ncbi:MAG: electron transfer flavoprotein subunit beta/FixA family protein [Clostridiales Family XIII bacterium]|jgi:electron transfer flavoprotein beta subunit|nr:electron transfer flavoprotein subunit beta/FixA family protein [Clostridiales Family XIII bacterium]
MGGDGIRMLVLVKQVPDMEHVRFDAERGAIDRASAGVEINPFDLNALEAARWIVSSIGGSFSALSMGPESAEAALRDAVALGASGATLLTHAAFRGADTLSTARTLAAAIRKLGPFDLVIAGEKSVDSDTGQVGAMTAGLLGIACVTGVERVRGTSGDRMLLSAERWGRSCDFELRYPGLITVTKNLNTPAPASLSGKLRAAKTPIARMGLEELGLSVETVGAAGSPTRVVKVTIPGEPGRDGAKWEGDLPAALDELSKALAARRIV